MKKALLVLLVSPIFCFSQQVFEKHFTFANWTSGSQIIEVPGIGYFIACFDDSLSFDSLGIPVMDFISGKICKLNYQGDTVKVFDIGNEDTLFMSQYGKNSDDFFRNIFLTDDGNLLVIGETQSYNASFIYDYDYWVLKFNTNLDLLQNEQFVSIDSSYLLSLGESFKMLNGNIVIPGAINAMNTIDYHFRLTEMDSNGNLIFSKTLLPNQLGILSGVVETSDHGFLATGYFYNNISNNNLSPIVIKTDSLANVEWYHLQPFSGDIDLGQSISKTNDGNFVYTWENVFYQSGAANKVYMQHATKIDEAGNELWTKDYGYSFDYYQRIKELPNGNLMMVGKFTDTLGMGPQAQLIVCNSSGDTLWTRKFSGEPGTSPGPILECYDGTFTSDGGIILTGETYCCNFTANVGWTSSLWVWKIDSLGLLTSTINLPKPELNHISLGVPYPNPTENTTTITSVIPPSIQNSYLLLFDVHGRQLEQIKLLIGLNQTVLNLSQYPSGEYLIALSADGFNAGTKKIIKR